MCLHITALMIALPLSVQWIWSGARSSNGLVSPTVKSLTDFTLSHFPYHVISLPTYILYHLPHRTYLSYHIDFVSVPIFLNQDNLILFQIFFKITYISQLLQDLKFIFFHVPLLLFSLKNFSRRHICNRQLWDPKPLNPISLFKPLLLQDPKP